MFESLNLYLFSILNAQAGLAGWRLSAAVFAAEWVILLVPAALVVLWGSGFPAQRRAAVQASLAAVGGLAISGLLGKLWFHPRPFMAGIGHTFMHHAPDSSFPSDHATIMFTVALVLAFSQPLQAQRIGRALLPLAFVVAWSRVFLGVHYPLDMAGALAVAVLMTLLVRTPAVAALCGRIEMIMETVYRRLLAAPIARGWLRP